jgi:hypothetical protein
MSPKRGGPVALPEPQSGRPSSSPAAVRVWFTKRVAITLGFGVFSSQGKSICGLLVVREPDVGPGTRLHQVGIVRLEFGLASVGERKELGLGRGTAGCAASRWRSPALRRPSPGVH